MHKPINKKSKANAFIKQHADGSIWVKGKIIADQNDGNFEWNRKDGIIMRSGYFENGKQIGKWTSNYK